MVVAGLSTEPLKASPVNALGTSSHPPLWASGAPYFERDRAFIPAINTMMMTTDNEKIRKETHND